MNAQSPAVIEQDHEAEPVRGGVPALPFLHENASLAVSLARAEIDQQIATARALPRSIQRSIDAIYTLATLDEASAQECVYALPRGGKPIRGPSIRLAEIISSQWGNCRVGARVVHVDRIEKYVEAEGIFHDLESNTATTARVRRRLSDKNGKLLSEDMIVVTGNAACAIAKRNAILAGVPKGVWRRAYSAVEGVIAGDVTTLVERRDRTMKAFAAFGVKPEQVFAAIGVAGLHDVTLEHMPVLVGMHAALKSGEATVEEMFSPVQSASEKAKSLAGKLDDLAAKPADDKKAKRAAPKKDQEKADPPHDPETGEIKDEGKTAAAEDARDAPSPERAALMEKMRRKAQGGASKLKLALGSLSAEDISLLTTMDREELEAEAKASDREAAEA